MALSSTTLSRFNPALSLTPFHHDLVTSAAKRNRRIAPAAEWLLDNFYLIEDQIRTARRHLPRSYSRELPGLAGGSASGYPRVYGIVLELIAHVDGRVDADSVKGRKKGHSTYFDQPGGQRGGRTKLPCGN